MKPSPPVEASTRRCAGASSSLRRWPLRLADRARRAWACLRRRAELLAWLRHTNHIDRASVVAGCCGDCCQWAGRTGPRPEGTSHGEHAVTGSLRPARPHPGQRPGDALGALPHRGARACHRAHRHRAGGWARLRRSSLRAPAARRGPGRARRPFRGVVPALRHRRHRRHARPRPNGHRAVNP